MTNGEQDKAFAAAAGQIAGAVATAYLGPGAGSAADAVVTAIAGAILGGDQDKVQKEIITKLDQINQKIDTILAFCSYGFREIVDQAVDANAIKQLLIDISNNQVELTNAMQAYALASPPTEDDAQRLITRAETTLASGRSIFSRSRERYLIAVPYFAQALGALLLTQRGNRKYSGAAANWAWQYQNDLSPWMLAGSQQSFPSVRSLLIDKLNTAELAMNDFAIGQPVKYINFLIPIYTYLTVTETYAYGAEYVLNADSTLTVKDLFVVGAAPRQVASTEDMLAVFGMKSHPLFPPVIGHERNDAYWVNVYSAMYHSLQDRAYECRDLPPRLEMLNFAIEVLEQFLSGLSRLAATRVATSERMPSAITGLRDWSPL